MKKAAEFVYRTYTNVLSITDVGVIQNKAWNYKDTLVREMGKGIKSTLQFLSQQPQERNSFDFEVKWLELPTPDSRIPGTDLRVTRIGIRDSRMHNYFDGTKADPNKAYDGIIVNLKDGDNEIQLQTHFGQENYVSYLDSRSYSPYIPHRDALHPPFVSTFHKARDVLIGVTETAALSLVIDASLRAVYGDEQGFPNLEQLEEIVGDSLHAQFIKKKAIRKYPSGIYHSGVYALFEKVQRGKQKNNEVLVPDQSKDILLFQDPYFMIDIYDPRFQRDIGRIED